MTNIKEEKLLKKVKKASDFVLNTENFDEGTTHVVPKGEFRTNIKEEVLKEVYKDFDKIKFSNFKLASVPIVEKAIDLTQQKMIEEFKEMIDKNKDKWLKVYGELLAKIKEMKVK